MSPDTLPSVSRREALRRLGLAALGIGSLFAARPAAAEATPAAVAAPAAPPPPAGFPAEFGLPALGYGYDALEPHIDARTMEIHHSKHHQAYVTNAAKALTGHADLIALGVAGILRAFDRVPADIRAAVRNNLGGHANHALYWRTLAPGGAKAPAGALAAAIAAKFGGLEKLQAELTDAGLKRFGSGWAWLSVKDGQLVVHSTANQDSPLSEGATPILGIDVWEHAYYLKHQNKRADYLAAFWHVVNWDVVAAEYSAATKA